MRSRRRLWSMPTKVASIKQALSGGTYTIDASSVADKMLKSERGLK